MLDFSKYLRFFGSDLDKFKLETQLATLTNIVDGKQVGIKDAMKNISSFRSSPSEVFLRKAQSNFIEIALRHGCSPVNLLHILRTPFPKSTSEGLLLFIKCILKVVLSEVLPV